MLLLQALLLSCYIFSGKLKDTLLPVRDRWSPCHPFHLSLCGRTTPVSIVVQPEEQKKSHSDGLKHPWALGDDF